MYIKRSSRRISRVNKLVKLFGPICYICGGVAKQQKKNDRIYWIVDGRGRLTADHVIPKCRGGKEMRPACEKCNNEKGSKTIDEISHWLSSNRPITGNLIGGPGEGR